jgi:hypothetical protein
VGQKSRFLGFFLYSFGHKSVQIIENSPVFSTKVQLFAKKLLVLEPDFGDTP